MEISKRNPITQDKKAKKPCKILPRDLFIRMYGKNPRKGSRERAIKNMRGEIAPTSRINRY